MKICRPALYSAASLDAGTSCISDLTLQRHNSSYCYCRLSCLCPLSVEGKEESAGTQEHIFFPALLPGGKELLVLVCTSLQPGRGLPVPPLGCPELYCAFWFFGGMLNCRWLLTGKRPATPLRGVKNKNSDFWSRGDRDALGSNDSCL